MNLTHVIFYNTVYKFCTINKSEYSLSQSSIIVYLKSINLTNKLVIYFRTDSI